MQEKCDSVAIEFANVIDTEGLTRETNNLV